MELKWLDDYLALVNCGSFTKAAAVRHITQPAFSRRIRALEHWLGVQLVDRSRYPTTLTEVGRAFTATATELRESMLEARDTVNSLEYDRNVPIIVCQHALAVSFIPSLLAKLPEESAVKSVKVDTRNYHDALEMFAGGTPDFLLCFATGTSEGILERDDIIAQQVGTDRLIPVSTRPPQQYLDDIETGSVVPVLAYPSSSFLGRTLTELVYPVLGERYKLRATFESALSEALRAMALQGFGVAWIPESLVADDIAGGKLWRLPEEFPGVDLQINLHRFDREYLPAANELWQMLARKKKVSTRGQRP